MKYQVFVSLTYTELTEECRKVIDRGASSHHILNVMTRWPINRKGIEVSTGTIVKN